MSTLQETIGLKIRHAEERDLPWLLVELDEFAKFATTRKSLMPTDPELQRQLLTSLINDHLFLVSEKEMYDPITERMVTRCSGFVAGIVVPHLLNPAIEVFHETFWWVSQGFRHTSAGLRLFDGVIKWCKENEVDWIFWSLQHNSPVSDRVLLKRGFKFQERSYLLEIE